MLRLAAALLAASLCLATLPSVARADQGTTAAQEERRTRLFREGKAAADAGDWGDAAERFREVVSIRTAPKALIALGIAEEKLGHLVLAYKAFKQAREDAADQELTDDLKTANAALESIRPRLPKLVFSPNGVLAKAVLEVDGSRARLENGAVIVDPGEHTVVATAPGEGTFRTTVTVSEREEREIEVVFEAASTGPQKPPPDTTKFTPPPASAIGLLATGVALTGAGGALYGIGSSEYESNADKCQGGICPPDAAAAGNSGRSQIIAGDVLMIAGGAALATGAVLWIVKAVSPSKKAPSTSLHIAPLPGGITLSGEF